MKVIAVGDIHGDYDKLNFIMDNTDGDLYLQVGDLAGSNQIKHMRYPDLDKPLIFISGNHDDPDLLETFNRSKREGKFLIKKNLWYLPMGNFTIANGIVIGGVGGNYSPNKFYEHRGCLHGRRRVHYTFHEMSKLIIANPKLDILLTHEAPSPHIVGSKDYGRIEITKLVKYLSPKYHYYGHHHSSYNHMCGNTLSQCLPLYGWTGIEI
jgi:Icc-related predicted phosphoesterase